MKNLEVPPFWPHQVEIQAVRTVTQLDLWCAPGVDVYPADADTAAALEIPLKGEPDAEFERGVAWFGRYCVPDLARYVEWRGPYETHDDGLDVLDTEYGSYCHGYGDAVKRWMADGICERTERYSLRDGHITPSLVTSSH